MPERETIEGAERDAEEGKAPSTQAGEFVREEMHHIREGKHGARSTKQAIAIGLSKARRAGVDLPAKEGTSAQTRKQAARDLQKGRRRSAKRPSQARSRAVRRALKREGHGAASHRARWRGRRTARPASVPPAAARPPRRRPPPPAKKLEP